MEKKEINGVWLSYEVEGEGERTLLFLHGNSEDSKIFSKMRKGIVFDGRRVFLDTRGHGESSMGEPFTVMQFAEDLMAFIRENGWERVTLVGYSDGANIAMCFETRYPAVAEQLVLISGNMYANGSTGGFLFLLRCSYLLLYPFRFLKAVKKRLLLHRLMLTDIGVTEDDLKGFTAKSLVISAQKDVIKDSHTNLIYQSIPKAEYYLCRGHSHFTMLSSEQLIAAVGKFLNGSSVNI